MRAHEFAAEYDRQKDLKAERALHMRNERERQTGNDFFGSALALFGVVLSATAILALLVVQGISPHTRDVPKPSPPKTVK